MIIIHSVIPWSSDFLKLNRGTFKGRINAQYGLKLFLKNMLCDKQDE